jgi:hypothetical protein
MKINEIIDPNAADDAEIAGTTPEGGVILKTKDGTEVTINDPDQRLYRDPRDGVVHVKPQNPNQPQTPNVRKPPNPQASQQFRPGDKIVMDKPQGRSF